jgi:S1-C subfamily serine protease
MLTSAPSSLACLVLCAGLLLPTPPPPDVLEDRVVKCLAPTIQLGGGQTGSVASGVIIGRTTHQGQPSSYLALTAWHCVRDLVDETGSDQRLPVRAFRYRAFGGDMLDSEELTARTVVKDPTLDFALITFRSSQTYAVAELMPGENVVLRVFADVIAVGCPLGEWPQPTTGIVASSLVRVDGVSYCKISVATYPGNSGGPVLSQAELEIAGIITKRVVSGGVENAPSHLGLMLPTMSILRALKTARDQPELRPIRDLIPRR